MIVMSGVKLTPGIEAPRFRVRIALISGVKDDGLIFARIALFSVALMSGVKVAT